MAEPIRTRTRLAREERREQIIMAAAEVFHGRDPAEVTFEEIADAAGVSRALVYNYFGDRYGLLEAVYRSNVARLQQRVSAALESRAVKRDALTEAVRVHVMMAKEEPASYRYAAGETPFPRLAELQEYRVKSLAVNFGGTPEAYLVARGLLAAIQSMVIYWLDHGGDDPDHTVEVISAFVWAGLRGTDSIGLRLTPHWKVPGKDPPPEAD